MSRHRKLRSYSRKKNSYQYCQDCSKKPDGTPKQNYVSIKTWALANNRTITQCKTLLRKRILVGISLHGRMFVALIGDLDDGC